MKRILKRQKERKLKEYIRNGVHKEAIERARKLSYHLSHHKKGKNEEGEHRQQQLQQIQQQQKPQKQQTLWWRLPYHPTIFNSGLKAKLNEVMTNGNTTSATRR
jgi:hypothetical protein